MLVIHLKRFSAGRYGRDKISDFVDFPLEGLDLSDRTVYRKLAEKLVTTPEGREVLGTDQPNQENMIYDLFAVDNHFGGLGGVCASLSRVFGMSDSRYRDTTLPMRRTRKTTFGTISMMYVLGLALSSL